MADPRISKLKKVKFGELQIIVGWKNIAAHIGLTPRTLQRYVHSHGFPKFSLIPNQKKANVAVEKNMLTLWFDSLQK